MNRFFKILKISSLVLIGLVLLLLVLVNLTPVQNFIARKAVETLENKLGTKVSVQHVRIDFLNHVLLQGLYIEDKQQDTLLYAGEARVRVTDWFIFRRGTPVIRYLGLHDAYAHLYRTAKSDEWNYQFLIDAFDTGKKDSTKKQNEFELDLEKADLSNLRFHMNDAWAGSDIDIDLGRLEIDAEEIDLKKRLIDINTVNIEHLQMALRDYDGGRPPVPKKVRALDTTAFNKGNWVVKADELALEDCYFSSVAKAGKPNKEFDPAYMQVRDIQVLARNISILGDTIRGEIKNLAAAERSGIVIKRLTTNALVSPNATICDKLYLETNNSILRDYYAMHYTRFPDFLHYIDDVVMEGHFKDARVDPNDVAYFAPQVANLPSVVHINGHVAGSVDSLTGKNLNVTDGSSTVKGDIRMIGLPDIYTTWIDYRNGEIYTNGKAIMNYAPGLRDSRNLALEQLTHAYFRGNYIGYIENFAANGILATNLGTISSDVNLEMPQLRGDLAVYRGTVTTTDFNAGALFRQPDLGLVSVRAGISGASFESQNAQLRINAIFDRLDYRGYSYQNITAEGLLAKNLFNGNLLVDDPNLALSFEGNIDFNREQLYIDAKAHLLYSNLTALKLVKSDSITADADFDLDWTGNSIDNFLGYARLYNVNLMRNGRHLDIDSVYLRSTIEGSNRQLVVESNALSANLTGNYDLSSIPYSFQYFISKYLPNYIDEPQKFAADQDIAFSIRTHDLDSLFGVLAPNFGGFNNTTITGSLNTSQQKLLLNADVPYGKVGNIVLRNANIIGDGNNQLLGLNAGAENVVVGDSVLHGSMSITTTVGNDSLSFNIATNSPSNDYGTVTLNGQAYAEHDSLFFNIAPSEFYLKQQKWEIAGGSEIILNDKNLFVKNLNIESGLQFVQINTREELGKNILGIAIRSLEVALLGGLAGLADYQPGGRVNGTINIENIFSNIIIAGDIRAKDVMLGTDTIGTINLVGRYDARRQIIKLEPGSGIFYKDASLTATGNVLFDSTRADNELLQGVVRFRNAPISWSTPLLEGFMSNLGGSVTGEINIAGTAMQPDIQGVVQLNNASMRLDALGTQYDIHTATVTINNDSIDLGNINIYDAHKNNAILIGKVYHNRFKDFRFDINAGSSKFLVIDLEEHENNLFYGNLVAGFQNLSIRGPLEDVSIRITRAMPRAESHLYLPIGSPTELSTYHYVSFQTYGEEQTPTEKKENRLSINIDAHLNELAEITLVLDPATGDAINARGTGNITIDMPANNELRMHGTYKILSGNYTFTLSDLFFKRVFNLTGGQIDFGGTIAQTHLDVDGVYTTRARLYDLLTSNEKQLLTQDDKETKVVQDINILLNMQGTLEEPEISFQLDVPNKRTMGTFAYAKLQSYINQDERQLFNQVASLLLINSFIPPDEGSADLGSTARTGAISNLSSVLSSTASTQLTNLVNRLDKDLSIDLRYKPYTADDVGVSNLNRNELSFGLKRNYYNDRLTVEVGSSIDWGRSTGSGNQTNFNPVGDFRAQYQLREGRNLRLNIFRLRSYDVIQNDNIWRGGVGLTWRRTFNTFSELFTGSRSRDRLEILPTRLPTPAETDSTKRTGTW